MRFALRHNLINVAITQYSYTVFIKLQRLYRCTSLYGCSSCEEYGGRHPLSNRPEHWYCCYWTNHSFHRRLAALTSGSCPCSSLRLTRVFPDEINEGFQQRCQGTHCRFHLMCFCSRQYSLFGVPVYPFIDLTHLLLYISVSIRGRKSCCKRCNFKHSNCVVFLR